MIRYFFICFAFLITGIILQQFVYGLGITVFTGKLLLTPLFFFCIASGQGYSATLFFALLTGIAWDADHTLGDAATSPSQEVSAPDNLKFGYSIFLFGITGFLMKFFQAIISYRGILVSTVLVFFCLLIYITLDGLTFYFVRGAYPEDNSIFRYILETAFYTSLIGPVILVLLGLCWRVLKIDHKGQGENLTTLITRDTLQ